MPRHRCAITCTSNIRLIIIKYNVLRVPNLADYPKFRIFIPLKITVREKICLSTKKSPKTTFYFTFEKT